MCYLRGVVSRKASAFFQLHVQGRLPKPSKGSGGGWRSVVNVVTLLRCRVIVTQGRFLLMVIHISLTQSRAPKVSYPCDLVADLTVRAPKSAFFDNRCLHGQLLQPIDASIGRYARRTNPLNIFASPMRLRVAE